MDRQDYVYASARIRVFEKRLLKKEQMMRLVQASSSEEFLRLLQETEYGKDLQVVERQEDFHHALDLHWKKVLTEVMEMTRDKQLIELLRLRYVYHNYKVLVKEKILGQNLQGLYLEVPGMDPEELKNQFALGERGLLPDFVYDVLQDYDEKKDVQRIDLLLDHSYFEALMAMAKELEEPLFQDYVVGMIDYANAKSLVRLKAQGLDFSALESIYLPGGHLEKEAFKNLYTEEPLVILEVLAKLLPGNALEKARRSLETTGSLSQVEKVLDDALMVNLRDASKVTFGPEVLFAYLSAKEKEIVNLRMIYTSLIAGISPERIEERLRDSYV